MKLVEKPRRGRDELIKAIANGMASYGDNETRAAYLLKSIERDGFRVIDKEPCEAIFEEARDRASCIGTRAVARAAIDAAVSQYDPPMELV